MNYALTQLIIMIKKEMHVKEENKHSPSIIPIIPLSVMPPHLIEHLRKEQQDEPCLPVCSSIHEAATLYFQ